MQIKINILCNEGYVADFLREVATAYENDPDNFMTFETATGIAEFSED